MRLRYATYVSGTAWNVELMTGLNAFRPKLLPMKEIGTRRPRTIRLPFPDGKQFLQLTFSSISKATADEEQLFELIERIFARLWDDVASLQLDDVAERLLLSLNRELVSHFLASHFENLSGMSVSSGVVREVMILLERASTQTYEGHPSEVNIAILPKTSRKNQGLQIDRSLFDVKRNRALLLGHRHVLLCDRIGNVCDVQVHPYAKFDSHNQMYVAPHEYQPSLKHAHKNRSLTFMLTRHGEILVAVGGTLPCVYRNGTWKLSGLTRLANMLEDELVHLHESFEGSHSLFVLSLLLALSVRHRNKGGMLILIADESVLQTLQRSRTESTKDQWTPDNLIRDRCVFDVPLTLLINAMAVDGATVLSHDGKLRDFGLVLNTERHRSDSEGARTRASEFASKKGVVIKISEDGPISLFARGELQCEVM